MSVSRIHGWLGSLVLCLALSGCAEESLLSGTVALDFDIEAPNLEIQKRGTELVFLYKRENGSIACSATVETEGAGLSSGTELRGDAFNSYVTGVTVDPSSSDSPVLLPHAGNYFAFLVFDFRDGGYVEGDFGVNLEMIDTGAPRTLAGTFRGTIRESVESSESE